LSRNRLTISSWWPGGKKGEQYHRGGLQHGTNRQEGDLEERRGNYGRQGSRSGICSWKRSLLVALLLAGGREQSLIIEERILNRY
jgi:hypothetical protein